MLVKLCRECRWSIESGDGFNLLCVNPFVIKKDEWVLASKEQRGTSCYEERGKDWSNSWFPACGRAGKLFDKKSKIL